MSEALRYLQVLVSISVTTSGQALVPVDQEEDEAGSGEVSYWCMKP